MGYACINIDGCHAQRQLGRYLDIPDIGNPVAIETTAHFEGVILGKTMIAMKTGASANGRLLAQTAVTQGGP
jgi:hypothetical protein